MSGLRICHDVFTASFFVSTDQDQNQIASFYTGAMARARELSIATSIRRDCALVVDLSQRSGGDGTLRDASAALPGSRFSTTRASRWRAYG